MKLKIKLCLLMTICLFLTFSCGGGSSGSKDETPTPAGDSGNDVYNVPIGLAVGFSLQKDNLISYRIGVELKDDKAVFRRLTDEDEIFATIPITGSKPWRIDGSVQFKPANETSTYTITIAGSLNYKENSTRKFKLSGTYTIKNNDNGTSFSHKWQAESLDWGIIDTGYDDVDFKKVLIAKNGGIWIGGEWQDAYSANVIVIYSKDNGKTWEEKLRESYSSAWDGPYLLDMTIDKENSVLCSTKNNLYKTNADLTFREIFSSQEFELNYQTRLHFTDKDHGFMISAVKGSYSIDHFKLFETTNGGAKWVDISDQLSSEEVTDINDFIWVDKNTGWVRFNNSALSQTKNGGKSWEALPDLGWSERPYFFDANNGWLSKYRTSDGGQSWEFVPDTPDYNHISFIDLENGWLISDNKLYSTTNGGEDWTITNDDISSFNNIGKLFFKNSFEGYIINYPEAYKTADKGVSWHKLSEITCQPTDIRFIDDTNGVFIGDNGIQWTNNGGTSWDAQILHYYSAIDIISKNSMKAIDYSFLLSSENRGDSWQLMTPGLSFGGFEQIECDNSIWLNSYDGLVNSLNNGLTWNFISNEELFRIESSENSFYKISKTWLDNDNYDFIIKKTNNNGQTWTDLPVISTQYSGGFLSLVAKEDTFYFNYNSTLFILDNENQWQEIPNNYWKFRLFDVLAENFIIAYGDTNESNSPVNQNRFIISSDNGSSWEKIITPYDSGFHSLNDLYIADLKMLNKDKGVMVGPDGRCAIYLDDENYYNYQGQIYFGSPQ